MDEVVSKARRGSDCRVQRAREQLTAEDQLEDTLLELTVRAVELSGVIPTDDVFVSRRRARHRKRISPSCHTKS